MSISTKREQNVLRTQLNMKKLCAKDYGDFISEQSYRYKALISLCHCHGRNPTQRLFFISKPETMTRQEKKWIISETNITYFEGLEQSYFFRADTNNRKCCITYIELKNDYVEK